jgi:hypothetical protein
MAEAVIVVSLLRSIGDGGTATFQTSVPLNADKAHLDAVVDKLHVAGRRFALHAKKEAVVNEIDHLDEVYPSLAADVQALTDKQSVVSLKTDEKTKLQQTQAALDTVPKNKARHTRQLAAIEKELA